MAICVLLAYAALFSQMARTPSGQLQKSTDSDVRIVQPGAPGKESKVLSPAEAKIVLHPLSEADVSFMQGMIMHHSQAVEMTALLKTHSRNKELLQLGERISISQTDEILFMKQWLEEHGKPDSGAMDMPGMDHMNMKDMPTATMTLMPGMLTPAQMKALSNATGPTFDYLFLTGMIQHHTGALTMVKDLLDTPGAGQDNVLFDFATDVDNTQSAEIRIMQNMLKEKRS